MTVSSETVAELLHEWAVKTPEKQFVTCGDTAYTFAELDRRIDQVGAAFQQMGVNRGDRVATLLPNRIEMLELYFGLARIGAIQVPLNAFLKGEFLRYQLADSGATMIVTDGTGHAAVANLEPAPPMLTAVVRVDRPNDSDGEGPTVVDYHEQVAQAPGLGQVDIKGTELMSIMYTSGTTGYPKGCMLSHAYYLEAGGQMVKAAGLHDDDVVFTALPMFHAAAQIMALAPALVLGIPAIVEPEFRPSEFFPRAGATGATVGFSVGAMANALLAMPPSDADRDHQMRQLHIVPLPADLQEEFAQRFGVDPWTEVFGQTECVPSLFNTPGGERRRHAIGHASDALELALLDDDGRKVGTGEVGEICFRPTRPGVMFDGYWGKPEATLEAFAQLWYHTGDYGRVDADGYVTFVDRKKDSLRRRGENVSSVELEIAIGTHPKVAQVAVHAIPNGANEDEIKACIVARPGASVEPEELFVHFKNALPYFAIPRYVEVIPELPRNAVGRVMKYRLAENPLGDDVWDFRELGLVVGKGERR